VVISTTIGEEAAHLKLVLHCRTVRHVGKVSSDGQGLYDEGKLKVLCRLAL